MDPSASSSSSRKALIVASPSGRDHSSLGPATRSWFDYIDDHVLMDILIRLPADSAHRCKSVSKRWLRLISSPHFLHLRSKRDSITATPRHPQWSSMVFSYYANSSHPKVAGVHMGYSKPPPFTSLTNSSSLSFLPVLQPPQKEELQAFELLGSCGGLVLCVAAFKNPARILLYVCNPLTRKWILLPPPPPGGDGRRSLPVRFGHGVPVRYGIVCKNDAVGFRVAIISDVEEEEEVNGVVPSLLNIQIFSSESGDWSVVDVPIPQGSRGIRNTYPSVIVAVNGSLHWCAGGVVSYDPYTKPDRCDFVPPPPGTIDDHCLPPVAIAKDDNFVLGECQGRIHVCYHLIRHREAISIWELDVVGGVWCLKHSVPRRYLLPGDDSIGSRQLRSFSFVPICFHPFEGGILYFWIPGKLLCCNLKSRKVRVVFDFPTAEVSVGNGFPFVLPEWPAAVS